MLSRADRGPIANWWWTIDRPILTACLILLGLGILFSFATSPAITARINIADSFHFTRQHIFFAALALITMIGISFLAPHNIRRFCVILFVVAFVLMVATLYFGVEIKGSRRWINLGFTSLQPSEFMKPAFVVVCAWSFAVQANKGGYGGFILSGVLCLICSLTLVLQKDIGQTMLICTTLGGLFFLAGMPLFFIAVLIVMGGIGSFGAYTIFPHVRSRVNAFLGGEEAFQTAAAEKAFDNGGWFGQGPGEGTLKRFVPDSHTDFVFSVVGEEYGIIVCILLVMIFGFIVVRSLSIAMKEREPFNRFAICGIAILFGLQSIINMAVNLRLMPPKGMTLPFISYGGSSMIAIAISMGILLSLTRHKPETRLSNEYRYLVPAE